MATSAASGPGDAKPDHFDTGNRLNPGNNEGMEFHIRRAEMSDLQHILHQRRVMFEEMGYGDAVALAQMEEASRRYFDRALGDGRYLGWLAEDQASEVVGGGGIVLADWPGFPGEVRSKRAWILNMYTEPQARRHGVARALVQTMIDWCRTYGLRSVWLHASDAGRPVYEGLGFRTSNEMKLEL